MIIMKIIYEKIKLMWMSSIPLFTVKCVIKESHTMFNLYGMIVLVELTASAQVLCEVFSHCTVLMLVAEI